jgi:hypothetical protein
MIKKFNTVLIKAVYTYNLTIFIFKGIKNKDFFTLKR